MNRTYARGGVEKGFGILVDYYGVARHLKDALKAYSAEDVRGALESLKGILAELEGRWDDLVEALAKLVEEAKQGRREDEGTGLDPATQAPFFDLLKQEAAGDAMPEGDELAKLCALTVELVAHIQQEIAIVGFWKRAQAQEGLRSWIFMTLDGADLLPFDRLEPVADRLMELAKANHRRLVG